ncbi:MAG TPA: sulfatase-like hydrolase/transferase, partial [Anaerolineales bacterium]
MIKNRTTVIFILAAILLLSACAVEAAPEPVAASAPYETTIFDVQVEAKAGQERLDDARPNIILIVTDDQPYETVQFMPTVRDVLLKGGVNFENGFITTPLCCPSRVSILTGEYVHNHKVYTNSAPLGGAPKFDDSASIGTWMQSAGYRTAFYGKYLNDYDGLSPYGYVPPGWSDWGAFLGRNLGDDDIGSASFYKNYSISENGTVVEYTQDNALFSADLVTLKSIDYIAANRDTPFFLVVSYYNPHSPYFWADRHHEQFRSNSALPAPPPYRPPNFMEEDVSDKPQYLQDLSLIAVEDIDISYK